ncbi:hypothetical protein [uncultured Bacteroides sp.]|uniref:hypothetical protein n=1 Tax=uncultured Bacteroides sp. TaxID=162156 RepID=UPI00280B597F|nr:hypothetical protein [uncultured Bacteroides sp.]
MITSGSFSLIGIQDAIINESCYKRTEQNVTPSTPVSDPGKIPEGWSDTMLDVSASFPYLWESQRTRTEIYTSNDISNAVLVYTGYRINNTGNRVSDVSYKYSDFIKLSKGQVIEVNTAGSSVSVISLSNGSTTSFTPVKTLNNAVPQVSTYQADEDCEVVVCVKTTSAYCIKIYTASYGAWSTPTLKNSWGKQGAKMRMRTWAADTEYLSGADGEDFYDVVIYLEKLYLCTKSHTSESGKNDPVTSINGYLGYWEIAQDWTFVATKLLLADKIKAEQIDATGLTATDVDISGKITAKSGKIGGWNINGNNLICNGFDTKIMIEASGERFMRINYDEQTMCYIRADSSIGIRIYTYGDNVDTRGISVTSNGKGIGLEVLGNALLKARSGENVEINGLKFNHRVVSDNSLLYTNDDIVIFKNTKAITFNMSSNAKKGKIIYMKKETTGSDVTMNGMFMRADSVGTMGTFTIGDERSRIFLYDGTYWLEFYCG